MKKISIIMLLLLSTSQISSMFLNYNRFHASTHQIARKISHIQSDSKTLHGGLLAVCGITLGILIHAKENPEEIRREFKTVIKKMHALPTTMQNFKQRDK